MKEESELLKKAMPTRPTRDVAFTRGDMLLVLVGGVSMRDRLDQALEALDYDPGQAIVHGDDMSTDEKQTKPASLRLREAPESGIVVPEYLYNAWAAAQMEEPTYLGINFVPWQMEFIKAYDDLSSMPIWEKDTLIALKKDEKMANRVG